MPLHILKPPQCPCKGKEKTFFCRLQLQRTPSHHPPWCQHHTDAEAACHPQGTKGEVCAKHTVQIKRVGTRLIARPLKSFAPSAQGTMLRGGVGDGDPPLVHPLVGRDAWQNFVSAQVGRATDHLQRMVGLGLEQLHQIVDAADGATRFKRRRIPFHQRHDALPLGARRIVNGGHGVQGNPQARQATTFGSKTTPGGPKQTLSPCAQFHLHSPKPGP